MPTKSISTSSISSASDDDFDLTKFIDRGMCTGFDHITFYVGSVNAAARELINSFGFISCYEMGLETGSKNICSKVVCNGNVRIQLMGTVRPLHSTPEDPRVDEIHLHIATHGDGVKDIAFSVTNVEKFCERAEKAGGTLLMRPQTIKDKNGEIVLARIAGIGDTVHTIVDRTNYNGFLPGPYNVTDSATDRRGEDFPTLNMTCIDHVVQNDDWNMMLKDCKFYKKVFGFHKFWSVDERQIHTKYSALKSTVMASENESVKMPVNEPAKGLKTSQIEEYMEFNAAAGIQHVAIKVPDILSAVSEMKKHGVQFINVPNSYYENLKKRMKASKHPKFEESFERIKKLGILIDYDENGYLLQLFTKPLFDRPTFFFEVIQRHNHNGFGAGNFKGLFEVLEADQAKRGNLNTSTRI